MKTFSKALVALTFFGGVLGASNAFAGGYQDNGYQNGGNVQLISVPSHQIEIINPPRPAYHRQHRAPRAYRPVVKQQIVIIKKVAPRPVQHVVVIKKVVPQVKYVQHHAQHPVQRFVVPNKQFVVLTAKQYN